MKLSETEATPFSLGDKVVITSGVWADREGVISEVHPANQMAIVVIDMFGRGTPVEIELTEIKKLA